MHFIVMLCIHYLSCLFLVLGVIDMYFGISLNIYDRMRGGAEFHRHVFILCQHWTQMRAVISTCHK